MIFTWAKTGKKFLTCFFEAFQFHHTFVIAFSGFSASTEPQGRGCVVRQNPDNWQLHIKAVMSQPVWLASSGHYLRFDNKLWLACYFSREASALVPCLRGSWGGKVLATSQPFIWDSQILYMWKLLEARTQRNNFCLIKAQLCVISLVFICIIKISTIELWVLPPTKQQDQARKV